MAFQNRGARRQSSQDVGAKDNTAGSAGTPYFLIQVVTRGCCCPRCLRVSFSWAGLNFLCYVMSEVADKKQEINSAARKKGSQFNSTFG